VAVEMLKAHSGIFIHVKTGFIVFGKGLKLLASQILKKSTVLAERR